MSAASRKSENYQHELLAANQTILRQGAQLLTALNDESYDRTVEPLFSFGVGCHIRHCLDAYDCFLRGIETGWIDYDARVRDARIETDRGYALLIIERMIDALPELSPTEMKTTLQARQDGNTWAATSLEREWQYLLSHTVHHYALIAVMLRAQGYHLSPHFGVAPSTLAHWGKQESRTSASEVLCVR